MIILSNVLCCLSVLLNPNAKTDTTDSGIKFEQELTWTQVKAKAQADNKYIFVDCYATWCGPCKMMDSNVYADPKAGGAFNDQFISIKVQMDTTRNDNDQTRKWYATAKEMLIEYKINAFPTYLFFSPDGKLVHKAIGYMNVGDFIRLSQLARDPRKPLYLRQYQHYKQKKKDYSTMDELAIFTRDLIGDRAVSDEMAKDYKENYLDKLEPAVLYTKKHIEFICKFSDLVHSQDKFFALCYQRPEQFDSIKEAAGTASLIVNKTISREEIAAKVFKKGELPPRLPDWNQIESDIIKKYSSVDARKLVLDYKINYYRSVYKDWTLWAKYKDEKIKTYPPKPPYGLTVFIDINGHGGAWYAFLNCTDKSVLLKALEWINLAINLEKDNKDVMPDYLDTKANLLYKLDKKDEALKLEKEAIERSAGGDNSAFLQTYQKMQRGEPTWTTE